MTSPLYFLFSTFIAAGCLWGSAHAGWICSTSGSPWVDRSKDLVPGPTDTANVTSLHVDPTKTAQAIEGFGGCFNELGWKAMAPLSDSARQEIMNALFADTGCAFNFGRMPIGASDYALDYYSLDDEAGDMNLDHFSLDRDRKLLIPYIKAAMAIRPDLKVWGSAWSPPAWMKDSKKYNGGSLIWEKPMRQTYAHYLAKAAQAYRQEGLNFYAVHVQNEPASTQKFPSCIWNGDQLRDFIRDDLGPLFQQEHIDAQIWLGTINSSDFKHFIQPTLDDKAARAFISGVGLQWDGKNTLTAMHTLYPDVKLMQTETECGNGSNDWRYAEETFGLMKRYLDNGVSSYMQWNMVLDETGNSSWGWRQCAPITVDSKTLEVRYNPQFYVVKHVSSFVKPGARKLQLEGTNNAIAFANPDGNIVVIWVNTEPNEKHIKINCADHLLEATMPAKSFNTFVLASK